MKTMAKNQSVSKENMTSAIYGLDEDTDLKNLRLKILDKLGVENYFSYFHYAKYQKKSSKPFISPQNLYAGKQWHQQFWKVLKPICDFD